MIRIHFYIFILFFIFISFIFKGIAITSRPNKTLSTERNIIFKKIKKEYYTNKESQNAVSIGELLPRNHSQKGDIEYTAEIQSILDKHRSVIFPPYPLLVNTKGLRVSSNSNLYFEKESLLMLESSEAKSYSILNLTNVESINIYSPKLNGDRDRRLHPENKEGEWGMGISIRSSNNINIFNAFISGCWGDGIYLGAGNVAKPNSNVVIESPVLINNRRNGVSIVSASSVTINGAYISRTNGTRPGAGIDIEPNNNDDTIGQITLNDIHTANNENYGILLVLKQLVGPKRKKTSIIIKNHLDENSDTAFRVAGYTKEINKGHKTINGTIKIIDPVWRNNKKPLIFENTKKMFPLIIFQNAKVYMDETTTTNSKKYFSQLDKNIFRGQAVFN